LLSFPRPFVIITCAVVISWQKLYVPFLSPRAFSLSRTHGYGSRGFFFWLGRFPFLHAFTSLFHPNVFFPPWAPFPFSMLLRGFPCSGFSPPPRRPLLSSFGLPCISNSHLKTFFRFWFLISFLGDSFFRCWSPRPFLRSFVQCHPSRVATCQANCPFWAVVPHCVKYNIRDLALRSLPDSFSCCCRSTFESPPGCSLCLPFAGSYYSVFIPRVLLVLNSSFSHFGPPCFPVTDTQSIPNPPPPFIFSPRL